VSPRQNRRRADDVPALRAGRYVGADDRVVWRGVPYAVRAVTGTGTTKTYRCPGCDQEIRPGVPHLVVWPAADADAVADAAGRRHWHAACWQARERRGVNVQRSRNAPRFG
jgi:hypothetical protein